MAKKGVAPLNIDKRIYEVRLERFPEDFTFQLSSEEFDGLRSQIGISKGKTGRRYAPLVFTEHGVAMLSSVLRSERAVGANIEIMRECVRQREMLSAHAELARKRAALEREVR